MQYIYIYISFFHKKELLQAKVFDSLGMNLVTPELFSLRFPYFEYFNEQEYPTPSDSDRDFLSTQLFSMDFGEEI